MSGHEYEALWEPTAGSGPERKLWDPEGERPTSGIVAVVARAPGRPWYVVPVGGVWEPGEASIWRWVCGSGVYGAGSLVRHLLGDSLAEFEARLVEIERAILSPVGWPKLTVEADWLLRELGGWLPAGVAKKPKLVTRDLGEWARRSRQWEEYALAQMRKPRELTLENLAQVWEHRAGESVIAWLIDGVNLWPRR